MWNLSDDRARNSKSDRYQLGCDIKDSCFREACEFSIDDEPKPGQTTLF